MYTCTYIYIYMQRETTLNYVHTHTLNLLAVWFLASYSYSRRLNWLWREKKMTLFSSTKQQETTCLWLGWLAGCTNCLLCSLYLVSTLGMMSSVTFSIKGGSQLQYNTSCWWTMHPPTRKISSHFFCNPMNGTRTGWWIYSNSKKRIEPGKIQSKKKSKWNG